MAIVLEANYAKKLGLPNYSSHQYCVTIRTELTDLAQVQEESSRLYRLLQDAVDREIQEVGFMPDASRYGMNNGNGQTESNGQRQSSQGNGQQSRQSAPPADGWACTEGQQKLILQLVHDHQLDKGAIEAMAQQLFGLGVRELNKMQASNLIDELLEKVGKKSTSRRPRWQNREGARA